MDRNMETHDDQIPFAVFVPYDLSLPVGIIAVGIAFVFLLAFSSFTVASVPIVAFSAVAFYFKIKHWRLGGSRSGKLPHETIDNFMLWEPGDEVVLGKGNMTFALTYEGVTENGLLKFLHRRVDERIYSPNVFEAMSYQNRSLERRRARNARIDKIAGENYEEFMESAREEFQSLMNENSEISWKPTDSTTSKSKQRGQGSRGKSTS